MMHPTTRRLHELAKSASADMKFVNKILGSGWGPKPGGITDRQRKTLQEIIGRQAGAVSEVEEIYRTAQEQYRTAHGKEKSDAVRTIYHTGNVYAEMTLKDATAALTVNTTTK